MLAAHSTQEVGVELVIGTAALALFAQGYPRHRPPSVRLMQYLWVAGILMLLFHGRELRAEELLHAISSYLHVDCV